AISWRSPPATGSRPGGTGCGASRPSSACSSGARSRVSAGPSPVSLTGPASAISAGTGSYTESPCPVRSASRLDASSAFSLTSIVVSDPVAGASAGDSAAIRGAAAGGATAAGGGVSGGVGELGRLVGENGRHLGVELDRLVARMRLLAGRMGRAERGMDAGVRAGGGHALVQAPLGALDPLEQLPVIDEVTGRLIQVGR